MRRIIIIGTALAVLVGAVVAYAASSDFNSYSGKFTFSPSKAGSKAKPSPLSIHETYSAKGNNGHATAPLTRVTEKIYGVVANGKHFPVCTAKMINDAGNSKGWNKVCPKGSLVAEGPVHSVFVPGNDPTQPGTPCNPYLTEYNGGQGTRVMFFEEYPYAPGPQYTCAGGQVKTGAAAAYNGYLKQQGPYGVIDIPLPASVSTSAGGLSGVYASLENLSVVIKKLTTKVHGKTVGYVSSVACLKGKRPYSFTFTAQNYQGQSPSTQTTTIKGSAKC